jgi:hypothetical protein
MDGRHTPENTFIFYIKRADFWLKRVDSWPKSGQNRGFNVTDWLTLPKYKRLIIRRLMPVEEPKRGFTQGGGGGGRAKNREQGTGDRE